MNAWICLGLAIALSGCVASESIGKDNAEGGDGATGTEAGDTSGDSGSESGEGTGGEIGPCDPEVGDSTCVGCQKQNCCPSWEACHADDRCVCITVCYFEGHSLDACIATCGIDAGEHADLITCTEGHCPDHCP